MQNSTTAILDTDQARYNATADAQSYLRQHGASLCDLLDALDEPTGLGRSVICTRPIASRFPTRKPCRPLCARSIASWQGWHRQRSTALVRLGICRHPTWQCGAARASASCWPDSTMSRRSGARCILQVARERRLSVYPGEFGMEQDICDVTLWLKEKFRETALLLWIGQHYLQRDHEVAEVTVITKPRRSHSLTPAAREAFLALGYAIENTGADTFGYPFCDCDHSRHEALQAFARIEAALQRWRSP